MCAVWLLVVIIRARSSQWLFRIRSVGLALPSVVASTKSVLSVVSSSRSLPSLPLARAWSVALLLDFFECLFVRFSSVLPVWSVKSSVRCPVFEFPSLVASVVRSFRSPTRFLAMSDNVDEFTPVSPSPSDPMSGATTVKAINRFVVPVSFRPLN